MGHGTGASLANILIVSPVASDLINRAILISGSALSPWAIQKDPLYVKRKVAEGTGCHGDLLDDDMAPCLRTKPLADLLSVTIDSPRYVWRKTNIYFIIMYISRKNYRLFVDFSGRYLLILIFYLCKNILLRVRCTYTYPKSST